MYEILNWQSRNEGRAGGQYYEYESNVRVKLVYKVVDTFDVSYFQDLSNICESRPVPHRTLDKPSTEF